MTELVVDVDQDQHSEISQIAELWVLQILYFWGGGWSRRENRQELCPFKNRIPGLGPKDKRKSAQEDAPVGCAKPDGELSPPKSFQAARRS